MDIVDDLRKDSRDEKEQYKREARTVMRRLLKEAADIIEQLRGQVEFESECRNGAYADVEIQNAKIERLRGYRNKILEEAALNAEGFGGSTNDAKNYWAREISESIRALKEKE